MCSFSTSLTHNLLYTFNYFCGIANNYFVSWNIVDYYAASSHYCMFANFDVGEDCDVGADYRSIVNGGTFPTFSKFYRYSRMWIVSECYARSDKNFFA